jgi:hypothetical protein
VTEVSPSLTCDSGEGLETSLDFRYRFSKKLDIVRSFAAFSLVCGGRGDEDLEDDFSLRWSIRPCKKLPGRSLYPDVSLGFDSKLSSDLSWSSA